MILSSPKRFTEKKNSWWVFLAGPIQGAPDWQHLIERDVENITFLSPRRESYEGFDYDEQTKWEHDYLLSADIIMFWIPCEVEHIEGRDYAQTTRTEFGEYLARGKRVVFGCYEGFPGERYFQSKLDQYGGGQVYHTLEDTLAEVLRQIKALDNSNGVFFTSDTHFGSDRARIFSRRPFKSVEEMDWAMIQRWNDKVRPGDSVYHLGDFGNPEVLRWLNGYIYTIDGNYERAEKSPRPSEGITKRYGDYLYLDEFLLVHEPLRAKECFEFNPTLRRPVLFGHIHGRQKCKPFGIDVGVDANNFTPMSYNDVTFYLRAIKSGYYDDEVWCQQV